MKYSLRNIIFIALFLFVYFLGNSQKRIEISVSSSELIIDSCTIIPSTVFIVDNFGNQLNPNTYYVDNDRIKLVDSLTHLYINDTFLINYNSLKLNLGKNYYHLDSNALKNTEKAIMIEYDYGKNEKKRERLMPSTIDYDGSFSRGFSVGNRQDLTMNSEMNLQMAGDIGGGINLKAAISDANIPFQPDGTTQRLNEFDKVYIQIAKDNHNLIAGDFDLINSIGYFSKYSKKLKGLKYSNEINLGKKYKSQNAFSIAISKGKFNRATIKSINGNQGPYKLYGANSEKFIIVLAGSEKVYIDGRLLVRGQDADYIIDYNLAEVIFNPKIMITQNSRITIEYEYSDQNYLRSLLSIGSSIGDSTKNFYFNFYNEQDSKSALGLIELDSADIEILKNSGDDANENYRSGIRPINQENSLIDKVYYKKVFNSEIMDSILVYTSNVDSAKYTAYFSDLGENSGSYSIDNLALTNGRVYKWAGKNKGRYEPVIQLIAPQKRQLFTLGTSIKLLKSHNFKGEFSFSNVDNNRYSIIGNNDNTGMAGYIELNSIKKIKTKKHQFDLANDLIYELTDANFSTINPVRNPEFTRDWNLSSVKSNTTEHLFTNNFRINTGSVNFKYRFSGLIREEIFSGNINSMSLNFNKKGFNLTTNISLLKNKDTLFNSAFLRPNIDISQTFKILKSTRLGVYFENEQNSINYKSNDSISGNSFKYEFYKVYLNINTKSNSNLNFFSSYRIDYKPIESIFEKYTEATEYGLIGQLSHSTVSQLQYNLTYRQLIVLNQSIGTKKPEANLLGKLNHNLKLLNGGLLSTFNVEFGSGQQARADYVFIKVAPGTGTHIWNDSNNDGVEGKDEFHIIEGIDTANYVKLIQYNNEFISANTSSLNYSLRILTSKFIKKTDNKFAGFLSKFSLNTILRLKENTISENQIFKIPFLTEETDTNTLNKSINFISTLFYNLGEPSYDINLGYKNNLDHLLQVGGFTENSGWEKFINLRINFFKKIDHYTRFNTGKRTYTSQLNMLNNYAISYYQLSQEINFYFNKSYGFKLIYNYTKKLNNSLENEQADINDFKFNTKLIFNKKTRFETTISYVNIKFDSKNTNLELVMLEGLKNGNNYIWNLRLNRRMKNNLDLIIQYDGRKTSISKIVHSAKMQARATF